MRFKNEENRIINNSIIFRFSIYFRQSIIMIILFNWPVKLANLVLIKPESDRFNYHSSKKWYRLLSIHLKITLLSLLLTPFNLGCAICAQQAVFGQDSFENTSGETADRLDTIIEHLEQSRQGSISQLYLTIIVFMMGLAFVIFGLYIGQEHKLSVFTKRLYQIAYFALIVPITVILVRYIANALLSGTLKDPVLNVAFLLLIPVTASSVHES